MVTATKLHYTQKILTELQSQDVLLKLTLFSTCIFFCMEKHGPRGPSPLKMDSSNGVLQ